jgi:hypothetical protein
MHAVVVMADSRKTRIFQVLRSWSSLWHNVGNCPSCMRVAFQAAFAAWAALVSAAIFADTPMLVGAITVSALGLTLLWLTHVIAFARKISFALGSPTHARYGALCVLARGLGVAAALSILPRLISVRRIYEYFGVGR